MSTSRLSLPARKQTVAQLSHAVHTANHTPISGLHCWTVPSIAQSFSVVWIQGKVIKIDVDADSLYVDDGTGRVLINHMTSVPAGCPSIDEGYYVMVVGELLQTKPAPLIKAMKIQDLSSDKAAQSSWATEVADITNFLQSC